MMTAAVFDQSVSVVFCADGVYQLLKAQDGSALEQKTFAQMFPALDLYDIRKIYVVAAALSERGLTQDELLIRVELITDVQLQALVGASKAVYVF
jgi:tRNA 2-thiouridine synthesizing protein C